MSKWVGRMDEIQGYQPPSSAPAPVAEPYVPKPLGILRDNEMAYGVDSLLLAMMAAAWKDVRMPKPTVCMNCDDEPFFDSTFSLHVVRGQEVLSFIREHSVAECAAWFIDRVKTYVEPEGPSGAIARAMVEE